MFRRMKRVYVIYTQQQQEELVSRLQQLGVLHLEETALEETEGRSEAQLLEERRAGENLLLKARGVLELFAEVDPKLLRVRPEELPSSPTEREELLRAYNEELSVLEGKLKALAGERRELRRRIEEIERFREVREAAEALLSSLSHPEGRTLLAVLGELPGKGRKRDTSYPEEIERTLRGQLGDRVDVRRQTLSEDRVLMLLSLDAEYEEPVRTYLEEKGLRPLSLPSYVEGEGFAEALARLKADEAVLPRRLKELDEELTKIAREHARALIALTVALENRLARLEAALRFGYTRYAFVVSGWVPEDELDRFRSGLLSEFPGVVVQEDPTPVHLEEVPVALRERAWAKPYQLFLNAFGVPKLGTVDPVPFISVFFPLFFAIIVGDIGYGLIIAGLALWGLWGFPGLRAPLFKKIPRTETGRSALKVMLHGGAFSIVLGFVFGEFFGLEFEQLGIHGVGPWPFSRLHNAIDLLLFTIVLGAVQVILGLAFGMVTALRHRDPKHLSAKIGLLLALFAFAIILGRLMGLAPEPLQLPGLVLLGVAVPLLWYGGGAMVLMESLSPFIHVLSYARIMGFGVASVVLAALINSVVGGLGTMGNVLLGVALGAVAGLLLHTINLVLHVFEGTIQSARLHWVEFFEKFLLEELGGKPYRPFREKDLSAVVPEAVEE